MLIDTEDKVFGIWDYLCAIVGVLIGAGYWFFHVLGSPDGNWFSALVAGILGAFAGAIVGLIVSSKIPRFVTVIFVLLVVIGAFSQWIHGA